MKKGTKLQTFRGKKVDASTLERKGRKFKLILKKEEREFRENCGGSNRCIRNALLEYKKINVHTI
jgi:hypothetical protein